MIRAGQQQWQVNRKRRYTWFAARQGRLKVHVRAWYDPEQGGGALIRRYEVRVAMESRNGIEAKAVIKGNANGQPWFDFMVFLDSAFSTQQAMLAKVLAEGGDDGGPL